MFHGCRFRHLNTHLYLNKYGNSRIIKSRYLNTIILLLWCSLTSIAVLSRPPDIARAVITPDRIVTRPMVAWLGNALIDICAQRQNSFNYISLTQSDINLSLIFSIYFFAKSTLLKLFCVRGRLNKQVIFNNPVKLVV